MALLEVEGLDVEFGPIATPIVAVDGIDLALEQGEVVACVGESGSGKSVTALALMGLTEFPGRVRARRLAFLGRDLAAMSESQHRKLVGKDMAMIFQDPLASLDPCYTVAFQLTETLRIHGTEEERASSRVRRARALELLRQVEIPDAEARLGAFPHQLSGGMAQRVMIAMAIACNPKLLIADEPTTALDVTVQAQVLALLLRLQRERGMTLLLITHDLAVVAETARRVYVLYAGQVVETGSVPRIFEAPRHPYTQALLAALPEHNVGSRRLKAIRGVVPGAHDRPSACLLNPRCDYTVERCRAEAPVLHRLQAGDARCHFPLGPDGRPTGEWRAPAARKVTSP